MSHDAWCDAVVRSVANENKSQLHSIALRLADCEAALTILYNHGLTKQGGTMVDAVKAALKAR